MLSDTSLFPRVPHRDQQIFYGPLISGATHVWQIWERPKNVSMIHIVAIGGGGGGGGGGSGSSTGPGGGGGGGGGAMSTLLGPLYELPDTLYISPGTGGLGAASGGLGGIGDFSYVAVLPVAPVPTNVIISSGITQAAKGGSGGTNVAGGSGGIAEQIATSATGIFSGGFLWTAKVGVAGVSGNTAAAGTNSSVLSIAQTCGGAGGGGATTGNADAAGGNITGTGLYRTITGGIAGGGNGCGGNLLWSPFISGGGSGGGSNAAGTGGTGGNGALGSGGGGGGGGTTGGAGGRGGDGIIIITCW